MKIDLSIEATTAIENLRGKLAAFHGPVHTRYSALVNAVVLEFVGSTQARDLTALSSRLITHSGRRRQLMKSLLALDEETFSKIENSVKKFSSKSRKEAKNGQEI